MKSNIKWAACFALLCVICLGIWLYRGNSAQGKIAKVSLDGNVIREIDLDKVKEPYEFEAEDGSGGHNTVRVERGRIAVTEADCPDKICVETGYIDNGAIPIVCLPHRLTITVSGNGEVDAVAGNN